MEKFKNLKEGEVLSETQYYQVVKKAGDKVQLKNDAGTDIVVDSAYVESCLTSAAQVEKEQKITKTEAAQIFISNPYTAMTANFNKQVKDVDVVAELLKIVEVSSPKDLPSNIKKVVRKSLEGEERTIVGRHTGSVDDFGRINFTDMNIAPVTGKDYDARLRLVDPRTLNWLILRGVKYIVK